MAHGVTHGGVADGMAGEHDVLLLEDDEQFAAELGDYLGRHGFRIRLVASVEALLHALAGAAPDAVILDQFIGPADILHALPAIRAACPGGLVFLTGNEELADRVMGLELGADDFISKLTPPREIVARLRSVVRRARGPRAEGDGGWTIDRQRRQVCRPDGTPMQLTAHEFDLLAQLAAERGRVVSREALSQAVLRRPWAAADRSIDNLVLRLRKQLAAHGASEELIKSVRGMGYVFTGFPEPDEKDG